MLASSAFGVSEIDISHVTSVNDDDIVKAHTQYSMNDARTRKKLYEGAMRGPFKREEKKGCTNLIFSDGAFNEVVLKAIVEIINGPKNFIVGKENVERITIDPRKELSGMHVDTKMEFKVNGDKILIHVYNSKQKLTIQGKKYKWFVDHYLEPFFKLRIMSSMPQIKEINQSVILNLKPKKSNKQKVDKDLLDEEAKIRKCDKCYFDTEAAISLRQHIIKEHSVNLFHGLEIQTNTALQPPQSDSTENDVQTNKSLQHPQTDSEENEQTKKVQESDKEKEQTPNITCIQCEFKFKTMEDLENHRITHEQTSVKCDQCTSNSEEMIKQHKFIHQADIISKSLHKCPKCKDSIPLQGQKLQAVH